MAEKAIIHKGFSCNDCSSLIAGTRYKCKVCDDFDLCEDCFKYQEHPDNSLIKHEHPLHPITKPIKNLKPQPIEKIVHEDIECDGLRFFVFILFCQGCGMFPVIGNCYECQQCEDFAFCQKCIQIKEHNPKHEFKVIYPEGQKIHKGFECEDCEMEPIIGIRYLCEKCKNYNLCQFCYLTTKHEHKLHPIHNCVKFLPPPPKGSIFKEKCNRCKKFPIDDNCYVCQTCKDFYFCERCYQIDSHIKGHQFGDINKKIIL